MSNLAAPQEIPVFVVLPPRTLLLDVAGPIEVLRRANVEQERLRFVFRYIGPSCEVASSIGLTLGGVEPLPPTLPDNALVVVCGSIRTPPEPLPQTDVQNAKYQAEIVRWLKGAIRPGIRLVLICSGALLAGHAGLLDGYDCTTHHDCCAELTALAPRARVLENRLYVEDGERFSSAGVTTGIDLMLHILAGFTGPAVAVAVARYLVVYLRRDGADPQMSPWLEGRNHMHPAVHRAQDMIAKDPARAWSLASLAREAAVSRRHLSRLFGEHSGMSVTDYINRMRLALAKEMLTASQLSIEHIAERAGFASARQFRRAWNRLHKLPPSRMRISERSTF
ncbi:MAG: GlxA family transcriptional regulator [Alphaproteobacteria bacterium]